MGSAASRSSRAAAKTAVAKATRQQPQTQTQTQTLDAALRSESSRDAVVVSHLDTSTRDLNGASLVRNPNAPPSATAALEEMNAALLEDARRFEDYDSVGFLQQNSAAFADTASAYRPRPDAPTPMPKDRTAAASAAFGGEVVQKLPGRVTNRQLRELLRLHYEAPAAVGSAAALAAHFELESSVVESVLASVGPPDVLEPRAPTEFPYGVWFERRT